MWFAPTAAAKAGNLQKPTNRLDYPDIFLLDHNFVTKIYLKME